MRLLFVLDTLDLGGVSLVALDWARGLTERGHTVCFSSRPGRLDPRLPELGFHHYVDDSTRIAPYHGGARRLRTIASRERVDLVHSFSTSTARPDLESFFGPHLRDGIPIVMASLQAHGWPAPRHLPRTVPVVAGRPSVARELRDSGALAFVVRPSVDMDAHRPGLDGRAFRERWGIGHDEPFALLVSRLPHAGLWLPSVFTTIAGVAEVAATRDVRLVIVGHGEASDEVAQRVRDANARIGRDALVFVGPVDDITPAYAAADVTIGMATSALRGMACGVPTIVLGVDGTAALADESVFPSFLTDGVFAPPDGPRGPQHLGRLLGRLLDDPSGARAIGAAARAAVLPYWSTGAAVDELERVYQEALDRQVPKRALAADAIGIAARHTLARARIRLAARSRLRRVRDRMVSPRGPSPSR